MPNSARYVYGLAIAMLKQKPPQSQGYWYLARAVNLSRGTPQGPQIAEFARAEYVGAGGSDSNWERFLIAARAPTSATGGDARPAVPMPPNSQAAAAARTLGQVQQPTQGTAEAGLQLPPIRKKVFIPRDRPLSLGILI